MLFVDTPLCFYLEMWQTLGRLKPTADELTSPPCVPGTRVESIQATMSWIVDFNGEVLWIKGLAGTGKSTLMSSIKDLSFGMGRLGAFIRFDRMKMNDPSRVITTLAYKLAELDVRIGEAIANAASKSPRVADRLSTQFKDLVVNPLRTIEELGADGPIVVLVDALDESQRSDKWVELLSVLAGGFGKDLPFVRLIVASRTHPDIERIFKPDHIRPLILDTNDSDIRVFFEKKLLEIDNDYIQKFCAENNCVDELTKRANGLFIWAATMLAFILQYPARRLGSVLNSPSSPDAETALNSLYKTALESTVEESEFNDDIKSDIRRLLGAVLVAVTPPGLTHSTIGTLLFGSQEESLAQDILSKLSSVISFEMGPIRLLHKSFDDFLHAQSRCGEDWYINVEVHKKDMVKQCLTRLSEYLDHTKFQSTYLSSTETVDVPGYIAYACMFWIIHASSLQASDGDIDTLIRVFLQKHFLKWLELMIRMNKGDQIIRTLQELLGWTNVSMLHYLDQKRH
jgi:hypothetical protein